MQFGNQKPIIAPAALDHASGGTANGGVDVSEVRYFTITVTPDPPRVLGVRINDGEAQRSMVTSITVTA